MENIYTIPPEVAALIPKAQLQVTQKNLWEYTREIKRLETSLHKCPKIGETDGMKEHPAIFHYFHGATDFYICEYDGNDLMYGFAILGGDLPNSEWGYFSLSELAETASLNIDYYWIDKSIEAALYNSYPRYFKMPQSLLV